MVHLRVFRDRVKEIQTKALSRVSLFTWAERDAASHVEMAAAVSQQSQPERSSLAMLYRPARTPPTEAASGSGQLALMVAMYLVAMFAGLALLVGATSRIEPDTATTEILAGR